MRKVFRLVPSLEGGRLELVSDHSSNIIQVREVRGDSHVDEDKIDSLLLLYSESESNALTRALPARRVDESPIDPDEGVVVDSLFPPRLRGVRYFPEIPQEPSEKVLFGHQLPYRFRVEYSPYLAGPAITEQSQFARQWQKVCDKLSGGAGTPIVLSGESLAGNNQQLIDWLKSELQRPMAAREWTLKVSVGVGLAAANSAFSAPATLFGWRMFRESVLFAHPEVTFYVSCQCYIVIIPDSSSIYIMVNGERYSTNQAVGAIVAKAIEVSLATVDRQLQFAVEELDTPATTSIPKLASYNVRVVSTSLATALTKEVANAEVRLEQARSLRSQFNENYPETINLAEMLVARKETLAKLTHSFGVMTGDNRSFWFITNPIHAKLPYVGHSVNVAGRATADFMPAEVCFGRIKLMVTIEWDRAQLTANIAVLIANVIGTAPESSRWDCDASKQLKALGRFIHPHISEQGVMCLGSETISGLPIRGWINHRLLTGHIDEVVAFIVNQLQVINKESVYRDASYWPLTDGQRTQLEKLESEGAVIASPLYKPKPMAGRAAAATPTVYTATAVAGVPHTATFQIYSFNDPNLGGTNR